METLQETGSVENDLQTMIDQVKSIKNGPRVLQLYMDLCAKCGICAEQCHVAKTMPERRTNPAVRADLIRQIYRRYGSTWGTVLKAIGVARDIEPDELETWVRDFYECSGCRRCAKFCPFGIDNSVLNTMQSVEMMQSVYKRVREPHAIMIAISAVGGLCGRDVMRGAPQIPF